MTTSTEVTTSDDSPISIGSAARWAFITIAIMGLLSGAIWTAATLSAQQTDLGKQLDTNKIANELRMKSIEDRQTIQETITNDINRKLDTVTTIVQRIDNKVGRP